MRTLPAAWQRALRAPGARKVVLVTVSPDGLDPTADLRHLAAEPTVIRSASDVRVHVPGGPGGTTLPFWPTLIEWPRIQHRLAVRQRRLEIAETALRIARGAGLAARLLDSGGGHRATVRIDLWTDGIDLRDTLLLFAGRVRDVPRVSVSDGSVDLIAADGEPDAVVTIGDTPLTLAEFPDAPAAALTGAHHQIAIGAFRQPIPCIQVDADGRLFYVVGHPLAMPPTSVAHNGVRIPDGWQIEEAATALGRQVTMLRFDEPVTIIGDGGLVIGQVTCAGGVGLTGHSVLRILLETLGGMRLTGRARELMDVSADMEFFADTTGAVLDLALRRLVPQTRLAAGFQYGRINAIPLTPAASRTALHVGAGLRYRSLDIAGETSLDAIANHIVVRCGRDDHGGTLVVARRTPTTGGARLRARLARSMRHYGVRPLAIDAPDLPIASDGAGGFRCPAGELLAEQIAYCHSMPATPRRYASEWLEGMTGELGDAVSLTDAGDSLTDAPMIIAGWEPTAHGPMLTLEDDPWA